MAKIERWIFRVGGGIAVLGLLLIAAALVGGPLYARHLAAPLPMDDYQSFRAWVSKAAFATSSIQAYHDCCHAVYDVASVQVVRSEAEKYRDQVALALLDDKLDDDDKEVVLAVAECLPLESYLALIGRLQSEGDTRGDMQALVHVLLPSLKRPVLAVHYKDERVRRLLEDLGRSPGANKGMRQAIDYILTGDSARYIESADQVDGVTHDPCTPQVD